MTDILNRPISVGDAVVFRRRATRDLQAGRVIGFTAMMVRIGWTHRRKEDSDLSYPNECAIVSLEDYIAYALARSP